MRYSISKYVSINNIDDSYNAIPAKYSKGYFILSNKIDDSEYLITETVKYYLDKFSTFKTEQQVLNEIKEEVNSNSNEIKEACSRFFKFLCKTKILTGEDKNEDIFNDDPLYKEGDIIDRFLVTKVLSNRAYTDLYSVTGISDGCTYVLKLLNSRKTMNASRYQKELKDMEHEYNMLQEARHIPEINKAHAFKNTDNVAYLILEYIDGKSLSDFMKDSRILTLSCSLYIIESIINAFSTLHQNHIIHGDIHPSNVLITTEKDARIIDLGLSKPVDVKASEIIKCGGVYFYMPPERINISTFKKYSVDADLYSDVYQVGLLMYFIVYNELPFEGFTWEELAQNIKEKEIDFSPVSFPGYPVPLQLINILRKCLEKDPAKRYKNAADVSADFKRLAFAKKVPAEI